MSTFGQGDEAVAHVAVEPPFWSADKVENKCTAAFWAGHKRLVQSRNVDMWGADRGSTVFGLPFPTWKNHQF
ncbi:hypothetical protein FXO38_06883 [Capsicum annuum]|nr:hypothetical protein FXO38_06883 [Capsicum annuum]